MSSLLRDPAMYPLEIHPEVVVFKAMTADGYAAAPWHDARCVGRDETVHIGRVERLLERFEAAPPPARPLHFIAHTAFCRSTLLSRLLGELDSCLALREPHVLVQLVERPDPRLLALMTALLARTFHERQTAVVKLNDRCNPLVPDLLARHPGARGILLVGDLSDFLVSVLRDPGRRVWLREQRLPLVRAEAERLDPLADLDPDALGDAEAAAYLWLARVLRFRAWTLEHDRLTLIDAAGLADPRRETLAAAMEHLRLSGDAGALARSPLFDRYSKNARVAFDPGAWAAERRRLAGEIEAGRALADAVMAAA